MEFDAFTIVFITTAIFILTCICIAIFKFVKLIKNPPKRDPNAQASSSSHYIEDKSDGF
ncbi:MAG: hypothetical protein HOE90_03270 [Bacteriovoracaceae bacterium]|nr:hypothetical protein [Bacteriovoracaceae bacterium]